MDGLTRVDYPDGNYVAYSYDNACRLTKVTTPFGTTAYEYDLLDRLTRVVDRNGYATVYEYDANGNRTAVHYANGFTTTYEYDLLNRLICEKTVDNGDNVVVQYIYTLGVAGERKSVTELDRTVEYTYDSLYRLTSETITEGEKVTVYTYAYDNVSNRILKTENGAETVYTYNALNQLVSDSETSYEYDLNGNLVRVIGSAQSALYEYNAENKLIKATVQNGVLVTEESYTYDYQGNRTSKTTHRSDGVTEYVKYLNDNSSLTNVLAEMGSEGSVQAYYTIGADIISQERDGNVSVYLYDGHGSVVGLANENGKVTDTYAYDAFGNLLKSKGSTKNCYRYCGEQFDETTGLYYLRARYMDTSTGRFISQDSYAGSISDPVSLHKYLYANSNPVTYSDPSGYMSMAGLAVRGAVIGALSGLIVPNAVSIIRNLVTTGEFKSDLSPMQNLANILNGVIFGALFGICAATFIAYGIIAGVAVSINFSLAYGCYIDGQNAAAAGQWDIAICSWFFCLFYLITGFTTISLANVSICGSSESAVDENSTPQKRMTWNEFQHANRGKYNKAEMSKAWKAYNQSFLNDSIVQDHIHGNDMNCPRTNYGYVLVDKSTGEILKFGETTMPNSRYSKAYLNSINAEMKILLSGSKEEIHYWQYDMNNYFKYKYGEYPPEVRSKNGW